jgi:hypothetical protein
MPNLTQTQVGDLFGSLFDQLALDHGLMDKTVKHVKTRLELQSGFQFSKA